MDSGFDYDKFIDDFKDKKWHRSYSLPDYDLYSYSSNKGKFGFSNVLLDILLNDFSPVEIKLFLAIVGSIRQTTVFEESCVVSLRYGGYKDVCSNRVFYVARSKFVDYGILIETPVRQTYIINPLYINKTYKVRIEK